MRPRTARASIGVLCVLAFAAGACSSGGSRPDTRTNPVPLAPVRVTSAAFRDGATVPTRYTCDGANESPPLSWDASGGPGAPVLVVIDPDAGNFVHWAVLLPRGTTSLRPGALPAGSTQYENDFANARYDGPCPPAGSLHHYEFQVSLVGGGAGLLPGPGSSSHDLIEAIQDHLVAEGTLTGTYSRS